MKVKVDDLIRREHLTPFGISEDEVTDAITNHDSKRVIPFEDYPVILFVKKMPKGYYLFVDGRWHDPELLTASVFKIFPQTLEGVDISNPVVVLQRFADEFGYNLLMGDQYNRFIFDSSLQIPKVNSTEDYTRILGKMLVPQNFGTESDERGLGSQIVKLRTGEDHDYVDVALAYMINNKKYIRYLHENDPGSVATPKSSD